MNKSQMIEALEDAKTTHLNEMKKIEDAIDGKHIENPTPLAKTECECGLWFYGNEVELKRILGAQLFERLDQNHENWHKDYLDLCNIFFKEEKKVGFFSKVLGKNKIDPMEIDKAKLYFAQLQKNTDELVHISDSALRRLSALSESKFN